MLRNNISFSDFVFNLQYMEDEYNIKMNRKYNVNTCTKHPRKISRYLTYVLYKLGFIKGHHVLFAHSVSDVVALYFVYTQEPLTALGFWLLSHLFDNCDGDLARIRGESDPKWGDIDVHLHLIMNMAFWTILSVTVSPVLVVPILASRVVLEFHRQQKRYGDRYGEKSQAWKIIVWPTNVNMMYLIFVVFACLNLVEFYLLMYAIYFIGAAIGQSVKWMVER